jgi:tetratricopeptide (TPR) repeat protein
MAALEYAAAAETARDTALLKRASEVTAECLQPSLTASVATRWMGLDPASVDAHRAAARAALELQRIAQSAMQYRIVLNSSPRGTDAEFAVLETELAATDNIFGARQLADRLVQYFPASGAALRVQAFAALRADDPVAAVRGFEAALAAPMPTPSATPATPAESGATASDRTPTNDAAAVPESIERRVLQQGLWRARILAGEVAGPLAEAHALLEREDTVVNHLDYALLLLAAQQNAAAKTEFNVLLHDRESTAVALRLLGLIEFQEGKWEEAAAHFAQLVTTGKFLDDALYYLGQIAERHADYPRALRLYAEVQDGDNAVAALLRAATILRAHGATPEAEELLDRLLEEEPQRAPEILAARARIYADAGDLPQAIALLDRGELQYPDSVELRYAMASTVEEQGKFADALRELKAVVRLRPDDPAALNAYGYTLADHHQRLGLAHKLIEQAYAVSPKNPAILDSLGWVLFREGQPAQALPYLNAAYADDRGGDTAAHLGEVLWQLGRQADAERVWTEAAQADADNRLLKATRQRLHASS